MNDSVPGMVQGGVTFITLWAAYQFALRPALLNMFRQELFTIRDGLFVQVAQGRGSFDDVAYGMVRSILNSTIRAASFMTLPQLVLVLAFKGKTRRDDHPDAMIIDEKFHRCISSMDDQVAANLYRKAYRDMRRSCSRHLARTYLPLMVLAALFFWSKSVLRKGRRFAADKYLDGAVLLHGGASC